MGGPAGVRRSLFGLCEVHRRTAPRHGYDRGPHRGGALPVDVFTRIESPRPPDGVAAFAQDPDRAPDGYENIHSVEWQTPPPLAVGSRLSIVAHSLGRRLADTYELRERVSGERFVMSTAEGPFPMETTYTWAPTATGTEMTLRNRGEPSGFSSLVASLMAMAMRRAKEAVLARLKRLLEGSGD